VLRLVAAESEALAVGTVRFLGNGMHARGCDPAIVEIEERHNEDREIDGFIRHPWACSVSTSFWPISGRCFVIFAAKRRSDFSFSVKDEDSRSSRTERTSSSLPSISAATAECDFQQ